MPKELGEAARKCRQADNPVVRKELRKVERKLRWEWQAKQWWKKQQRLGTLGAGITPLLGGTLGTSTMAQAPQTSPLGTALGIGSTLAGIYGMMK